MDIYNLIHTVNKQHKEKYENLSKEYVLENLETLSVNDVLSYNKYEEEFLKKLIPYVNMKKLLITQDLSLGFIFQYILNEKYHFDDDEKLLDIDDVVRYQRYSLNEISKYIESTL